MQKVKLFWIIVIFIATSGLAPVIHSAGSAETGNAADFERLTPRHLVYKPPRHRNGQHHQQVHHQHHHQQVPQFQAEDNEVDDTVVARRSFPNAMTQGCASCVGRDLFLNYTKDALRVEILRKLGMKAPPDVIAKDAPQDVVRRLLNQHGHQDHSTMQSDEMMGDDPNPGEGYHGTFDLDDSIEEDDYHFQTKQINIMAQNPTGLIPEKLISLRPDVQFFSMSSPHLTGNLWKSVLRAKVIIRLPEAPSTEEKEANVTIRSGSIKNGEPEFNKVTQMTVRLRATRSGWVDIDISGLVTEWFKNPNSNFGMVIDAYTKKKRRIDVGLQQNSDAPYIQLEMTKEPNGSNRNKRNIGKVCSEETDANESSCCLWPFTVDFEKEYGWTFIIHPAKYEANFCAGDCKLGVAMPTNNYGHLIQQANFQPCCTPQKMSGINMLYMDADRNVILGKLPKMKVERCGCA